MSNSLNPYAPPALDATLVQEPQPAPLASQGRRFLNLIIDTVVIQVVVQASAFAMGMAYGLFVVAPRGNGMTAEDEALMQMMGFAVGILVSVGYFIVMEAACQRTVAKFLTGTRVVTPDGRRPTLGQIVGRSFARIIPFEAFSFLGNEKPVGWHDSLSGTRVVMAR